MEIIGSGIDATEIVRIAESIERYGDRFVHRVFTDEEIAYCRRKRDAASSFAARFAAKEAAMKALGTGHSRGVFWRGIEVFRYGGPPQLRFHGGAAMRFKSMGATSSFLTLTHSRDLAIAHVLLLRANVEG
jgi:holo-[acyl-carrier protein] synthase